MSTPGAAGCAGTAPAGRCDDTLDVFDLARKICREAAAECNKPKIASVIASAKTVAAVERLARPTANAATVEQWDADPWPLNTPVGVVDLRSGDVRPHQADYMTKITGVAPDAALPDSAWRTFSTESRRRCRADASCSGGRLRADRLDARTCAGVPLWHWRKRQNVFLDAIAGMLGDYHRTAPIETFTAGASDRHPTELAGLRGARLVTAIETEEGRRWAEAKIKALTGGDKIAARFMRQDFFESTPQFKLMIAGNHKPGLRSVDEAIRRRFHLVPFTVTIPPDERDRTSMETQAEWPGILAWMIEGCLEWQRTGLAPPRP